LLEALRQAVNRGGRSREPGETLPDSTLLKEYRERLVAKLEHRNEELEIQTSCRRASDDALRVLTEQLEQRILERTAELEAANRNLEAFCWSVSHELRAPLRYIQTFAKLALKAEGDPARTRHCLCIVADSA
jgi:light-regulated signal transduction histidine kinase (bacteriophytochrome)